MDGVWIQLIAGILKSGTSCRLVGNFNTLEVHPFCTLACPVAKIIKKNVSNLFFTLLEHYCSLALRKYS